MTQRVSGLGLSASIAQLSNNHHHCVTELCAKNLKMKNAATTKRRKTTGSSTAKQAAAAVQPTCTLSPIKTGQLKTLLEMPVDIMYEVFHPLQTQRARYT